jgi:quaternary ammonium compound-resistance protein SugE
MAIEWVLLLIAGICETCFAVSLKLSDGFSRFWPSLITVFFIVLSFILLSLAMKEIPLGSAYAIWTGIGAAGTVLIGMLFFGEPYHLLRICSLLLIVVGLIGLQIIE